MNHAINAVMDKMMNDDLKLLKEVVGREKFKEILMLFGGGTIYLPQLKLFKRAIRNERICSEFNGHNLRALSAKYEISTTQIKDILKQQQQ